MSEVLGAIGMDRSEELRRKTGGFLDPLIQPDNYVGEVVTLSFEEAVVQVHDHQRQRVGGLPSQAFLVATRKAAGDNKDWNDEDATVILLRVIGPAPPAL